MTRIEGYKLAQAGDFDTLYKTHKHSVHAAAFKFTHNQAEADDLSQDVWLNVYRYLHKFNGLCTFKTWVYEITFRRFLQNKRPVKKQFSANEVSLEFLQETGWEQAVNDQHLVLTPIRVDLIHAIESLPRFQQQAVYGFVEGKPQREHGVHRATISNRLTVAKEKLRKELSR